MGQTTQRATKPAGDLNLAEQISRSVDQTRELLKDNRNLAVALIAEKYNAAMSVMERQAQSIELLELRAVELAKKVSNMESRLREKFKKLDEKMIGGSK